MSCRALLMLLVCAPFTATATTFIADDNPPFNYAEGATVSGLSTDLITEMAKRAEIPASFEIVKWGDGYARAQKDRDTCLYSTARLNNRERLFFWVGPLGVNRWAVFGRQDFGGKINRIEDLRSYRIGGVVNDAKLELLAQFAVTSIRAVADDKMNPPRLNLPKDDPAGIDLWITSAYTAQKASREVGGPKLKQVLVAQELKLYLACSTSTSRATVKALQASLDAMTKDGAVKRITAFHIAKFAR